ncbi:ciliogenesis and planar polarity effector 2-like [Centruroides vittatus]|uniref:ciliogenesis and planar polarity effector 2-like n=1 Tax=Centruroides vittatus TaxID=120091 RepID=UPI00350FD697
MNCKRGISGRFLHLCTNDSGNPKSKKIFGLLETPNVPLDIRHIKYKVYIVGKAGVGKSFLSSWLSGLNNNSSYYATSGTQVKAVSSVCEVYSSEVKKLMFTIEFWESGSVGRRKPVDLIEECPSDADAVLLMFSYAEKESLKFISDIMIEFEKHNSYKPCFIAVGSGWNLEQQQFVRQRDIQEFEGTWKVPVLQLPLYSTISRENYWKNKREEFILFLCEELCLRDQILSSCGIKR